MASQRSIPPKKLTKKERTSLQGQQQQTRKTQKLSISQKAPAWMIPAVVILTFIVYIPNLNAGFVNWDDPDYVVDNLLIRDLANIGTIVKTPIQGNYHPLTMLSLAINYAMTGLDAWSYHLFNIVLHIFNSVLAFNLAFKLSRGSSIIAFTTALLFALHPMHVESVAWVTERKDVLYSFFFLLGLISYTRYVDENNKRQLWFAVIYFILSLASKPAAVIFPLALLTIDILRERRINFRLLLEKTPFWLLAILMGVLTFLAQQEKGAVGSHSFDTGTKILMGFYGIMMYLVKMIVPFKMATFYPYHSINVALPAEYYIAPLVSIGLLALILLTWKRNRVFAFGILFFIVNLLLVLQFLPVGSAIIADRYTYLPYFGMFFILGWLLNKYTKGNIVKASYFIVPVGIILAFITYNQVQVWQSSATLWDHAIKVAPSSRAYNNRALILKNEEGNLQRAAEYYTMAVSINAADHEAYTNRGNIYFQTQQYDQAKADYLKALSVKPDYNVAHDNLGALYASIQKYDSALHHLNISIQLQPEYFPPYKNRALCYIVTNQHALAIPDYEFYLKSKPDDADVWNALGSTYRQVGKSQEAINAITKAISLKQTPDFYYNRSITYLGMQMLEQAKADALAARQRGYQLNPDFARSLGIQ